MLSPSSLKCAWPLLISSCAAWQVKNFTCKDLTSAILAAALCIRETCTIVTLAACQHCLWLAGRLVSLKQMVATTLQAVQAVRGCNLIIAAHGYWRPVGALQKAAF